MRFLMVDDIVEMVPGKRIHAVKTLAPDEDLFRDHFPGFPVVPGVLLTEMMAQAAGKCLDAEERDRGKAMLVQIRGASFHRWVRPGQRADIHASVNASTGTFARASARIEVEGGAAAGAELLFAFVARDQFASDFRDEVLERYQARIGSTQSEERRS